MNFLDFKIGSLTEIPEKIVSFFSSIVDMIVLVLDALQTLYNTISTFHYLVGDMAFYMIYLTVLFGCLWTIYKIVVLLYEAIDALIQQATGQTCKGFLSGMLGKFFK